MKYQIKDKHSAHRNGSSCLVHLTQNRWCQFVNKLEHNSNFCLSIQISDINLKYSNCITGVVIISKCELASCKHLMGLKGTLLRTCSKVHFMQ